MTTPATSRHQRVIQHLRNWMRKYGLPISIIGIGFYTAICIWMVCNEPWMVYPGALDTYGQNVVVTPDPRLTDVEYQTEDNVRLTGRLLERRNAKHVLVFFHGNGEKAAWLDDWAVRLSQNLDATVLIAEYRGFADALHIPDETGLIRDGLAASNYMSQRFNLPPQQLIYYGRSIGGGVALAVAVRQKAQTLVLERTFNRLVDVAASRFWLLPVHGLMHNRFDSQARIEQFRGRLIQLHGTRDEIIPEENARELFDSYPSKSNTWITLNGLGHNDPLPDWALGEVQGILNR